MDGSGLRSQQVSVNFRVNNCSGKGRRSLPGDIPGRSGRGVDAAGMGWVGGSAALSRTARNCGKIIAQKLALSGCGVIPSLGIFPNCLSAVLCHVLGDVAAGST